MLLRTVCWLAGWLVVKRHVNTERSICANCGGGKPAQSAKDGHGGLMLYNTDLHGMTNEIQCILP